MPDTNNAMADRAVNFLEHFEADMLLDGGTLVLKHESGSVVSIDRRIGTETPGRMFYGFPEDGNPVGIERAILIRLKLLEALDQLKKKGDTHLEWIRERVPLKEGEGVWT